VKSTKTIPTITTRGGGVPPPGLSGKRQEAANSPGQTHVPGDLPDWGEELFLILFGCQTMSLW
jgi:hypothetical protein